MYQVSFFFYVGHFTSSYTIIIRAEGRVIGIIGIRRFVVVGGGGGDGGGGGGGSLLFRSAPAICWGCVCLFRLCCLVLFVLFGCLFRSFVCCVSFSFGFAGLFVRSSNDTHLLSVRSCACFFVFFSFVSLSVCLSVCRSVCSFRLFCFVLFFVGCRFHREVGPGTSAPFGSPASTPPRSPPVNQSKIFLLLTAHCPET